MPYPYGWEALKDKDVRKTFAKSLSSSKSFRTAQRCKKRRGSYSKQPAFHQLPGVVARNDSGTPQWNEEVEDAIQTKKLYRLGVRTNLHLRNAEARNPEAQVTKKSKLQPSENFGYKLHSYYRQVDNVFWQTNILHLCGKQCNAARSNKSWNGV